MKVGILCEFSGTVRDAFLRRGHDAVSCDLLPSDNPVRRCRCGYVFSEACGAYGCPSCEGENGPAPECHIQGDCLAQDWSGFDLLICHPPCTYLCSSGLHWNKRRPGRDKLTEAAVKFVMDLWALSVKKIAIENPIGCLSTRWREPDQIIQPWQFGDDASKATCLWLKGLPALAFDAPLFRPTTVLRKKRYANQTASGQNSLPPSDERWKLRSVTYAGIAQAMVEQWGGLVKRAQ